MMQIVNFAIMTDTNQDSFSLLRESFRMFDIDGDGVITTHELKQVMTKLGYNSSQQDIENMIKILDKDGNGTVSLNEYIEAMMRYLSFKISHSMEKSQFLDDSSETMAIFKLFDKNCDGLISPQQLKQGLQILGDKGEYISEEDIKELFDAADIDGDNFINYDEFVRMLKFK